MSLLLGRFIYSVETQVIQTEFEKDVISERLAIEQEVSLNLHAIKSLKNYYDHSQYVDPDEFKQFANGTETLAHAVANSMAFSLAGGGDTIAAIESYGIENNLSYVSTAGGAFLEFVEGKKLPAIEILERRTN